MAPQAFLIAIPFVPAFPVQVEGTSAVPWAPLGGITVSSYPPVRQQPNSSVAQAGQQNPLDQQPQSWSLPNVLLEGFVGQKPQNNEELKIALLEVMPECYHD